jgi:hypothetical protein
MSALRPKRLHRSWSYYLMIFSIKKKRSYIFIGGRIGVGKDRYDNMKSDLNTCNQIQLPKMYEITIKSEINYTFSDKFKWKK